MRKTILSTLSWTPVAIAFLDFVASVHPVEGGSMSPNLSPKFLETGQRDYILLEKSPMRVFPLNPGDVVAIKDPESHGQLMIKRLIGVQGDVLKSRNDETIYLESGKIWVEGDNESRSRDSNQMGPLPAGLVVGKASAIVWPPERFGAIPRNESSESRILYRWKDLVKYKDQ